MEETHYLHLPIPVPTFMFTLAFTGVDPWDDSLIAYLANELPRVNWCEVNNEVRAVIFAEAWAGARAVVDAIAAIQDLVPQARVIRMVGDIEECDF